MDASGKSEKVSLSKSLVFYFQLVMEMPSEASIYIPTRWYIMLYFNASQIQNIFNLWNVNGRLKSLTFLPFHKDIFQPPAHCLRCV